ncbi:MAG: condensation domain-containing protein [Lachnospiraceae bacterium]|jgi:hypothetical protein|nr:condensation domain-containing protein [Lachnospiraceae bacterium]
MRIENGKKLYPLTAAQKLHFFYQKYCPKKQVLNIGTSLTIQQSLDFGALKDAIYQAYDRCESMRLRFTKASDGNVYQYLAQREVRDIEFFDFTGWQECHAEDKMREWTAIPFQRFDTPLNRVVMIITPDGFQGIYLLVDHMTMDAQSLILFLKDVIEIYCNKKYEGIEYPKEMSSYIEQLEKDLFYEAGSKSQKRDAVFFEKMIAGSEPIFNSIFGAQKLEEERKRENNPNLRAAANVSDNVDANIVTFQLEEDPSNRLMEFCSKHHISMVCLLMMGLRTYLQKVNGNDDVSVNTTVARRATLAEKRCGGTRIHCFPFRTIVDKKETFMEGLLKIRDGQNKIFRHANYDPTAYYAFRNKHYGLKSGQTYEPLSLTYQPLTLKDKGLDRLQDIRYKSAWYSNGAAAHALYLTVMHRAEDNGLNFNFEHQTGVVTYHNLEYLYYYLCRILFKGIENPEMTVGEIIEAV